jgi:hypothetical protein
MTEWASLGKMLLLMGGLMALAGLILLLVGKVPLLGHLPGDIAIRRGKMRCFVPIATSILLSLLLTLVLNLIARLLSR